MMDSTNTFDDADRNPLDSALDAGLRAAFGRDSQQASRSSSVVAILEQGLGVCPRVLLRDTDDDPSPVAVSARAGASHQDAVVGRYQLAGEIGRGGAGIVLKGRDPDLGRDVAIKVLRSEFQNRGAMVARFVEEAQIAAQLQHPGIPSVYELGISEPQRPYFAMKLIKGRTLAALLRERTDPTADRQHYVGLFEHVCQAVGYAHAKGVVHRDLKPSNVMVGLFGEIQVVDWGLAKVLSCGGLADERDAFDDDNMVETVRSGSSAAQSMAGSILGTPAYMSPEQAQGQVHRLSERSDVFSLGAILCEILTGAPPFTGDRDQALEKARQADLTDALNRLDACDADAELVDIAKMCLLPSDNKRPRTAGEVAERISGYLESLADRARASELAAARASAAAKQERRARRLTVALTSVILAATVLIAGGAAWIREENRQQQAERAAALNTSLDEAAQLLGQASAAAVGQTQPWMKLNLAVEQIRKRLSEGEVDEDTTRRAESLLAKVQRADRDRRLIEKIEEVVIMGATHEDKHSWLWMEKELRTAFNKYGIDLQNEPQEQIAERIKESELAAHLTDGLELWMGTCAHLHSFGVRKYPVAQLVTWIEVLYAAEPDPFATAVRRLVYAPAPTAIEVRTLMDSVQFADVRPRTLAWLASAAYRTGDMALVREIFRRAVLIYPDDLMLNFDYAYNMMAAKDYSQAIRSYDRCLALRPNSGGIWRGLGIALRHVEQYADSIDALNESIKHQPDHAPTYADLGLSLEQSGDVAGAVGAYERALELNADIEVAKERLAVLKPGNDSQSDENGD